LTPATESPISAAIAAPTLSFLAGVAERLGHYVYVLSDPRDNEIFYVGKGKGQRVYQHAAKAQKIPGETGKELKLDRIRGIHAAGLDVRVDILRHGLTEEEAFEVEAGAIDLLRLTGVELTNRARGMWSQAQGWAPLDDLRGRYAAPPVTIEHEHRVVLIRINRAYRSGMSDEELYKATREWWVIAPRRRPDYAFAVYRGIVRAVYRIDPAGWERESERGRWRFAGERDPALEAKYAWRSVAADLPSGAQNPIRYVNC
jgi:uncharacterized protein